MIDVNKMLDQRRSMFISTRRDIEVWIEKFFSELEQVNPSLLENITFPTGKTAQEIFPSLYIEPFNEEAYTAERAAFDEFYNKVMEVAEYLNKKAAEVLAG